MDVSQYSKNLVISILQSSKVRFESQAAAQRVSRERRLMIADRKYDFSDVFLRHECVLGLRYLLKRKTLGDKWNNVSALDVLYQVGEYFGFEHCTAEETQVLQIERSNVELNDWATDSTSNRIASLWTENVK